MRIWVTSSRGYLPQCNIQSLDRDGDGVPCEALWD
ncbi:MAG: excalibur calcium-binding domain-containing protein [bacterium]